jgi:hypothetical protein
MIRSLFSALLAAQAPPMVAVAPPAPPSPPMPMVSRSPMIIVPDRPAQHPASNFEVEISAGRSPLWSATLRTAYGRSASFRESLDQAAPDGCGLEIRERQVSQRLEIGISPVDYRPAGEQSNRFTVGVIWVRPASPGSCPDLGTRTVEVQRIVTLRPGEEIEIEGDAGLRVRLRRLD